MSPQITSRRASVDEIQSAIDDFVKGLPTLQAKQFDRVYGMLKELSLDADGKIKSTVSNLKIIGKVQRELESLVDNPLYQEKVGDLYGAIDKVNEVQTKYFTKTFADFTTPPSVKELQGLAMDNTVESLTGSGVSENVIGDAMTIVEQHIRDGSSFNQMVEQLKEQMVGNPKVDGKLVSYSKQIINDTFSGFSRNYHDLVTSDLDLEWFEYIGGLVDSSRPVCIAAVEKRWFHKSELPALARGIVNGIDVGTAGMMPGTNGSNVICRCGGYNCNHQLVPVSAIMVPSAIRRPFEKDISPDKDELTNERPRRKQ